MSEVLSQIESSPHLWDTFNRRKTEPSSPHSQMSDIWVRYNSIDRLSRDDPRKFHDEHVPVWYPAWSEISALQPIVFDLMAKVRGEMLGGILITKIPSGMKIEPHTDHGWHVEYYKKFYVSLESGDGARFYCNHGGIEEFIEPQPGECYLFDNRKLHWVVNDSGKARTTLIVCIRTDEPWRSPCHSQQLEQP